MALIKLDVRTLYLRVEAGILEEYKPDTDIEAINDKVNELREATFVKMEELFGTRVSKEAMAKVKVDKEAEKEWTEFVNSIYTSNLNDILSLIDKKNKEICEGFKELVEQAEQPPAVPKIE